MAITLMKTAHGVRLAGLGVVLILAEAVSTAVGFSPWDPYAIAIASEPNDCTGHVLLTFDDGPHPEFTPRIVDVLNRSSARATFFAVGQKVAEHPEVAAQIVAGGQRLENHTWDHPYLSTLSPDEVSEQLIRTNAAIEEATGITPSQWRPPYEEYSPESQAIAASLGLEMVLWDYKTDTNDWRGASPEEIRDVVLNNATDGSIVLMHDRIENTARAVPMILDGLHQKGLCTR
jgi:peptidoglycan/xylan/chitin deacetylase (PgdA/CDA1 family)